MVKSDPDDRHKNEARINEQTAGLLEEILELCITGEATLTIVLDRDQYSDAEPHRYCVDGGLPSGSVQQMFGSRSVRQLTGVLAWVVRNNGLVTLTVHDTPGLYGGTARWGLYAGITQRMWRRSGL